ncbi:threonyl-tRNA synthetase [Diplodia seriata]|nr:putative threonyl-trna synthetase [Diplodia seriata]
MLNKLANFLRTQYPLFGFREVITPTMYKKSLWEESGHWENYADDMFSVQGRGATGQKEAAEAGEDEEFGLKPMNCPGHCLLFASEKRNYRNLPIRYADFSALHRNEVSGALSGLTRVRRFHQDDGHIFCRPSQIQEEIKRTLDFVGMVYDTFGLGPYKLMLSTRPEAHYIGMAEEWDRAESQLKAALEDSGREWAINAGDGAFYGPKIDIILRDSDGKEHQTATIQLDFQLPQRFNLFYTAPAPELERTGSVTADTAPELLNQTGRVTPVIIHRAILGSLERFLALLIEHYDGKYPFWLAPRPAIILSVSQDPELVAHVQRLARDLAGLPQDQEQQQQRNDEVESGMSPKDKPANATMRPAPLGRPPVQVDVDTTERTISKKLREARFRGYNHILVVGSKEMQEGKVQMQVWNQPNVLEAEGVLHRVHPAIGGKDFPPLSKGKGVELEPRTVREYFEGLMDRYL